MIRCFCLDCHQTFWELDESSGICPHCLNIKPNQEQLVIPKKDCTKTVCPLCESRCQAGSTDSGFIENEGACFRCIFGKSKEEIQTLLLAKEKLKDEAPVHTSSEISWDMGKEADKSASIVMLVVNDNDEQVWTGTSDSFSEAYSHGAYNDAMDRINKYEMAREPFLDDTPATVNSKAKTKPEIKPWTRWVTIDASEETELTVISVCRIGVEFIYHSKYGNSLNWFETSDFLSRYRPIGAIGIDDQLGMAIHELKRAIDNDNMISLVKASYRILDAMPTSEVSE